MGRRAQTIGRTYALLLDSGDGDKLFLLLLLRDSGDAATATATAAPPPVVLPLPIASLGLAASLQMSHRRRSNAGDPPPPEGTGGSSTAEASSTGEENPDLPWAWALGSERRVLALALAFRAANALLVRTYFNPDEHWQCLEVAHRIVFGYGHLTWEWKRGLRSYLHPFIFAALYKILSLLHLDSPWFMLFSQLVNWFMFFCITRTLSNSMETVLTVTGLYYWFVAIESVKGNSVVSKQQAASKQSPPSRKMALLIAALACAIRPTSAITWLYVGLLDFIQMKSKSRFIFLEVVPLGVFVLAVTTFLDCWMYGSRVIVPLNFLKFNLFSSGGDYYGTHVFHWYFSQGHNLAAMAQLKGKGHNEKGRLSRLKLSVILLILTNVPMALYMSLYHQRGTEDAMLYLSREAHDGRVKSVLFLMPCHSTPYYSTLHYNLPMRFLDCTPSENKGTLDESDRFLMNPADFVGEVFGNLSSFSHIVLFESEERHVKLLLRNSFQEVRRFFHSHFKVDRDLQSSVVVYSQKSNA
uniref:Mannosyltransferase n=1 Tax=Oryza barthii TaxID=65489 RepID=A0A0D3EQH2_9ORYZ